MAKVALTVLVLGAVFACLVYGFAATSVEQYMRTVRRVTYAYWFEFGRGPRSYEELMGSLDKDLAESIDVERRMLRAQVSFLETNQEITVTFKRPWFPSSTLKIEKPIDRKVAAKAAQLYYPKEK